MISRNRSICNEAHESSQSAFVKQYHVPANYSFPDDFDLSKNSILLAESIRGAEDTLLYLYWSSAERARALEPKVEKNLGLANSQIVGDVIQIVTPQRPKWLENPAKWGQWLVTAAAIFGALSVIQDHFANLFGHPSVVIIASDKALSNFRTGDRFDLPMEFRNQATLGHVDVHIESTELRTVDSSGPPVSVQPAFSDLPQIQAGQKSEVHLFGSPISSRYSKVQHYILAVSATAKEGMFWPAVKVASSPFEIVLWPDRSSESILTKPKSPNSNVIRVEIKVGSGIALEKGLRGQLTLISTAIPDTPDITLSGAILIEEPIVVTSQSGSSVKVQFQTGALQAFHTIPVTLTIAFREPLTETQWNELKASMKVVVL